ncbi:MAG: signal peptidase II [Acidimicrobiales bacterium]
MAQPENTKGELAGRSRFTVVAAIVVVELLLDQLTKAWAQSALDDGHSISVLPTLEFDLFYNSGFSFSTGTGRGSLVGVLVFAVVGYLLWLLSRETDTRRIVLFAVILGGALGNLSDRLFRAEDGFLSGEVVDFIDVSWYAVFNLADTFVVVGALTFGVTEVLKGRDVEPDPEASPDP